jgi:hypothetical protein
LTAARGVNEVGSACDIPAFATGGTKGLAIHVRNDKMKRGIALLNGEKIFAARLGIPRLDRRQLRERNQYLVNSLNDL